MERGAKRGGWGDGSRRSRAGAGAKGLPTFHLGRTRLRPTLLYRAFPMAVAPLTPARASRSPGEETKAGWAGMDERELL